MDKFWLRDLPSVLTAEDFFQKLGEREIHRLYARLAHIEQIYKETEDWVNLPIEDLKQENAPLDFLDNLELDMAIVQAQCNSENDTAITSWLIHSTWLAELPKSELIKGLPPSVLDPICLPQPTLNIDLKNYRSWLAAKNRGLRNAIEMLFSAIDLKDALANLLAIDVLLTDILLGLNKWRLMDLE